VAKRIVLLRGVNLGARNRIAMPELRDALADAGFRDVRTSLQSGNVVLSSAASPEWTARKCEQVIAYRFRLAINVVVRTRDELAEVVQSNPLRKVAVNPRRHQVTFMTAEPDREAVGKLTVAAVPPEQFVVVGREIYAWHP